MSGLIRRDFLRSALAFVSLRLKNLSIANGVKIFRVPYIFPLSMHFLTHSIPTHKILSTRLSGTFFLSARTDFKDIRLPSNM